MKKTPQPKANLTTNPNNPGDELAAFDSFINCVNHTFSPFRTVGENEFLEKEKRKYELLYNSENLDLFNTLLRYIEKHGKELTIPMVKRMWIQVESAGQQLNFPISDEDNDLLLKHRLRDIYLSFLSDLGNFKVLYLPKSKAATAKKGLSKPHEFSHRQIAIAYCVMGIVITKENATEILIKHSSLKSTDKLIQKRINRVSDLTKLSGNRTADTKHLNNLEAAKRLISGTKNRKAKNDIDRVIKAFESSYNKS